MTLSVLRALGIIFYRTVIGQKVAESWDVEIGVGEFKITAGMVTSITASAIDTIAIVILDFIFERYSNSYGTFNIKKSCFFILILSYT